jgi:hypothetical protein
MSLSQKQLQNVCLLFCGDHRQCRYLEEDSTLWKWNCTKHKKSAKVNKDLAVENYVDQCNQNGIDPKTKGVPIGDNCPGYPLLRNIEQGYDKDP